MTWALAILIIIITVALHSLVTVIVGIRLNRTAKDQVDKAGETVSRVLHAYIASQMGDGPK